MVFAGAALVLVAVVVVICIILLHPAPSTMAQSPPTNPTSPSPAPLATVPPPEMVEHSVAPPSQPTIPSLRFGDFEDRTDIGDVQHHGFVEFDFLHHKYSVAGSGADIFGAADAFHFVWREMSGDVTLKADITFLGDSKEIYRKGVLMIRQSLDAGSPYADVAVHGNGLIALQYRLNANDQTLQQHVPDTGATVWLERRNDLFTLYVSNGGEKPTVAASITVPLGNPVYVGIGTGSHNVDNTETAVFSGLMIRKGAGVQ